jgi:hypothetical protein
MRVDMQIARRLHIKIKHAVARDLVEHVVKEGHAGCQRGPAAAVKIKRNADLRFIGIAVDLCLPCHDIRDLK